MCVYVFGYGSALKIYRELKSELQHARATEIDLADAASGIAEIKEMGWLEWFATAPHLIVKGQADLRDSGNVRTHAWGTRCRYWPVLQIANDIYVSSPEFLFLQMANVLDTLPLTFLGYELCGAYQLEGKGQCKERPLTSRERIERFLCEHAGARGVGRAKLALGAVLDGSASPMETALALRLALPCKRGGRGIELPQLNHTVSLNEHITRAYGFDHITPDLLWERWKLAMEYDSDDNHTGADRIATDSRRRLVLETAGYDVITVTNAQMKSMDDFDILAEHVARKTRKRVVPVSPKTRARQYTLAHELQRLATDPRLTCPA